MPERPPSSDEGRGAMTRRRRRRRRGRKRIGGEGGDVDDDDDDDSGNAVSTGPAVPRPSWRIRMLDAVVQGGQVALI